jgi:DNA polymerase-3 subunit gamma/tau
MKQAPSYQVIARKYRPQNFASILGQDPIVATLKNALRFRRLAQAYLFTGSRGTGKTTIARVFAKALNCQNLTEDLEPCNTCSSCLEVAGGRSLDVLEIDGASNRGIDDIRQINETVGYAPSSGKYKIYLIDEVHMLTKEAFNALLKTLEEPPPNVKFFFATTEPHKVLATIVSRCQRFDLSRIPIETITLKLSSIAKDLGLTVDERALHLIAHLAEGCLRDAESLFDQVICYAEGPITLEAVSSTLGVMPRSVFFALDQAIHENRLAFAFELAAQVFASGKDLSYLVDHLMEHFRLLMLLKLRPGSPLPAYLTGEEKEHYQLFTQRYTEQQCLYNLDYLMQSSQQISKTSFKRVNLEMVLLHLIRSHHRVSIDTLVKRLVELESGMGATPKELPPAPVAMPATAPVVAPPAAPIAKKESPQEDAQEDQLIQTLKDKLAAPPSAPKAKEESAPPLPAVNLSRYETILRFAAVELEGTIKKDI